MSEESPLAKLIPVINKLQDALASVGGGSTQIDLPQICVCGSQSSGKSSVLESLVGRDFLPRGSGIVTRRPLILQLFYKPKGSDGPAEYGEFLHKPGQIFESFDAIRQEIINATDVVAGANKGVSPDPIRLKIYSPFVLNLTLVDLPGLTKVPVGDQPQDIEIQIRKMVMQFIKRPNAIILAVSAANSDIATSDALQIAREVDPNFDRTVGVLTKLDLMDRGTNAADILANRVHPLRLGWIGVVNRSQADIDSNLSVAKAREAEAKFFESSAHYRDLAAKNGTPYLSKALNDILIAHIQATLPELRLKIQESLTNTSKELEAIGNNEDDINPEAILLSLINQYSNDYNATIDGKSQGAAKAELVGGARISYIFTEVLDRMLSSLKAHQNITAEEIKVIIRNSSGPMPSLFLPDFAFQFLSNRMIQDLEGPCVKCLDLVYDELVRICRNVPSSRLRRYQGLRNQVVNCASELLRKLHGPTKKHILDSIKCELSYTNTRHPAFQTVAAAEIASLQAGMFKAPEDPTAIEQQQQIQAQQQIQGQQMTQPGVPVGQPGYQPPQQMQQMQQNRVTDPVDHIATNVLPKLLKAYYEVVRVKIQDSIPKIIMFFLVNKSKEEMQAELVTQLYKPELVGSLLTEDDTIVAKRKSLRDTVSVLGKASSILDEVRDLGFTTSAAKNYRPATPGDIPKQAPMPSQQPSRTPVPQEERSSMPPQTMPAPQAAPSQPPAPAAAKAAPARSAGGSFLNLGPLKS